MHTPYACSRTPRPPALPLKPYHRGRARVAQSQHRLPSASDLPCLRQATFTTRRHCAPHASSEPPCPACTTPPHPTPPGRTATQLHKVLPCVACGWGFQATCSLAARACSAVDAAPRLRPLLLAPLHSSSQSHGFQRLALLEAQVRVSRCAGPAQHRCRDQPSSTP